MKATFVSCLSQFQALPSPLPGNPGTNFSETRPLGKFLVKFPAHGLIWLAKSPGIGQELLPQNSKSQFILHQIS